MHAMQAGAIRQGAGRASGSGCEGRVLAAERRRWSTVMAPERLGELSGLAVADSPGHVTDRVLALAQELGGTRHADALQLAAETGATGLREGALELPPRRRDAVRHLRKREVLVRVVELHHPDRVPVQLASPEDGGLAHRTVYGPAW